MKEYIKDLFDKRANLNKERQKITEAIEILQELCEHDWKSNAYDLHRNHYTCSNYGK